MKKISNMIIEDNITEVEKFKTRTTIRAIIMKDNKVLMLYSKLFDDFTFPGGGMKDDEDKIEALKRELKEEIGADEIKNIRPYGYQEELRYGISGSNSLYKQTSYYYKCDVSKFGERSLVGREKEQGIEKRWVDIEEAILHNKKVYERDRGNKKGLKTVLLRENAVLKSLLEGENEEI